MGSGLQRGPYLIVSGVKRTPGANYGLQSKSSITFFFRKGFCTMRPLNGSLSHRAAQCWERMQAFPPAGGLVGGRGEHRLMSSNMA